MNVYRPRKIASRRPAAVNDWTVKVYVITNRERFDSEITLQSAVAKLPEWLETFRVRGTETHRAAFLIVHEGLDGVWTLMNWWMDGEILRSLTFYTDFSAPADFRPFPANGFMACVWEMEVIMFERGMWIEHVLKKAERPDFETYLLSGLSAD